MALIDASTYGTLTATALTGADATSLAALCTDVSDALSRMMRPYVAEPTTITSFVLDAPVGNILLLPFRPVRSITSIYLRWGANGDASAFTSDDLLANYDDYYSPTDPLDGFNRSGVVYRRGSSMWACEPRWLYDTFAPRIDPNRGAVKVTCTAGETAVPGFVRSAAVAAVSLMLQRRKTGAPLQSESWNGYSGSYSGPFTAVAAVNSPEVIGLLRAGGVLAPRFA